MREIFVLMVSLALSVRNLTDNSRQADSNLTDGTRQARFLNLFSVIRFSNTPCYSKNGLNGTCYTEKQCQGKGQ